jgi:uncharacterized protein (TIGR02271 family)
MSIVNENNHGNGTKILDSQTNPSFEKKQANDPNVHLKLQQEQLDIIKNTIQSCEVHMHKEIINEEKTITIPIIREELVIEKRFFNKDSSEQTGDRIETIRMPVREEQIEIVKHSVDLADIDIYKRQFQEIEHIETILKHEEAHIETNGQAKVTDYNLE